MLKKILVLLSLLFIVSCDATIGKFTSLGSAAKIVCYSGGKVILDTVSSGKVLSEPGSGYFFKDSKTKKMTEIDAQCIITYQ